VCCFFCPFCFLFLFFSLFGDDLSVNSFFRGVSLILFTITYPSILRHLCTMAWFPPKSRRSQSPGLSPSPIGITSTLLSSAWSISPWFPQSLSPPCFSSCLDGPKFPQCLPAPNGLDSWVPNPPQAGTPFLFSPYPCFPPVIISLPFPARSNELQFPLPLDRKYFPPGIGSLTLNLGLRGIESLFRALNGSFFFYLIRHVSPLQYRGTQPSFCFPPLRIHLSLCFSHRVAVPSCAGRQSCQSRWAPSSPFGWLFHEF